ncbi:hypothetical protein [Streptomyces sp. enrichment culture]|uniref:hypothetical protein n=1 Tax=Streptomyces sp. enrichment culture TaxID=1795815 RepID=UPI003F55CECE
MVAHEALEACCRGVAFISAQLLQHGGEAVSPDHRVVGGDSPGRGIEGRPQSGLRLGKAGEVGSLGLPAPSEPAGHLFLEERPVLGPGRLNHGHTGLCRDPAQCFR